jgi:alkanesulfonate monooxygenase SsuD/methylene tetrahydromethanopterin reductase-like flavin-dependent oxidoreductase (luciferase family)
VPALKTLDAACVKAGRDPTTLQRTVTVFVDLPGSETDPSKGGYSRYFASRTPATGTPEQLAELLRDFARLGVCHVQICMASTTKSAIDAFAPVLEILDRG